MNKRYTKEKIDSLLGVKLNKANDTLKGHIFADMFHHIRYVGEPHFASGQIPTHSPTESAPNSGIRFGGPDIYDINNTNNLDLFSWQGISFSTSCNISEEYPQGGKVSHTFNTRNGDAYFRGSFGVAKNIYADQDLHAGGNIFTAANLHSKHGWVPTGIRVVNIAWHDVWNYPHANGVDTGIDSGKFILSVHYFNGNGNGHIYGVHVASLQVRYGDTWMNCY